MAWALRGLREGIVTTRYPKRPDDYGPRFRASVTLVGDGTDQSSSKQPVGEQEVRALGSLCPVGAIEQRRGELTLDRGKCILCGRCVEARPDRFAFGPSPEIASVGRSRLVVPSLEESDEELARLSAGLAGRVKALHRSVHLRHVDAGSDGSEEWELAALTNPVYDVQRLGVFFTASPRHADLLLVTGTGTAGMAGPLRRTYEAMPDPKAVIAVGTDAISGGLVHPSYTTAAGIGSIVPVDVFVPGSPPSPFSVLYGILLAVGLLPGPVAR